MLTIDTLKQFIDIVDNHPSHFHAAIGDMLRLRLTKEDLIALAKAYVCGVHRASTATFEELALDRTEDRVVYTGYLMEAVRSKEVLDAVSSKMLRESYEHQKAIEYLDGMGDSIWMRSRTRKTFQGKVLAHAYNELRK